MGRAPSLTSHFHLRNPRASALHTGLQKSFHLKKMPNIPKGLKTTDLFQLPHFTIKKKAKPREVNNFLNLYNSKVAGEIVISKSSVSKANAFSAIPMEELNKCCVLTWKY